MTWTKEKQAQLNELQQRQYTTQLSAEEQTQLQQLLYEIEQSEWEMLQPTLAVKREEKKRLQRECNRLRSQNAGLALLATRYEDAASRAKMHLADLLDEHETLKREYEDITGRPLVTSS